jgi:Peptidase family M49
MVSNYKYRGMVVNKTSALRLAGAYFFLILLLAGCEQDHEAPVERTPSTQDNASEVLAPVRPEIYADFALVSDLQGLSDKQRQMLVLLIEASKIMDDLYWRQAFGDNHVAWLQSIDDPRTRYFADINYGPWDRLDEEKPFIAGVGEKPLGARFYPADMTRQELEVAQGDRKEGLYSLRRRNSSGSIELVAYHDAYAEPLARAAALLREASELADHEGFANYLRLRADAFLNSDYQPSDLAWMDVKTNPIELVIGPIETYEDRLFGYRSAFEAYVLIKDIEWSERLAKFSAFLPELQRGLPVPDEYKTETPGSDSDLNAYDVIYYAGHSNAGSKTIAINLPNDEEVQLSKGTRRLQLKNAMQAKFEKILKPIADVLLDESQRRHVTFDAFFTNTMFHEVAHGLGVKNTINGKGLVRASLRDIASSMEEGKADILGLYMIVKLHEAGELGDIDLRDNYVTMMAGLFRSIRFGASSAHGKANMLRFNFFAEHGAFVRDDDSGTYRVDFEHMEQAMSALSNVLLVLQGDGDYEGAVRLTNEKGTVSEQLRRDLQRLSDANIPVDITFTQGVEVLGLN